MRIAEIMSDFRALQHYIAQIQANPSAEEYYLEGYSLLRACIAEAQAVLTSPYAYGTGSDPQGDLESEKTQLQAYVTSLQVLLTPPKASCTQRPQKVLTHTGAKRLQSSPFTECQHQ